MFLQLSTPLLSLVRMWWGCTDAHRLRRPRWTWVSVTKGISITYSRGDLVCPIIDLEITMAKRK